MQARIYQPAKPAVSSGRFKTRFWMVEFEPRSAQRPDRLIGWVGSDDTDRQLSLRFDTRDEAIAYDVASALVDHGVLPELTYRQAVQAFGEHGAAELIYLVGLYCLVSVTLNGFDVPVPEPSAA